MADSVESVTRVAAEVRRLIADGRADPASAISLVRAVGDACRLVGVDRGQASDVIEAVLVEIAKGKDGVLGTEDDLVAPRVLDALRMLCDQELVRDLAAWAAEACVRRVSWLSPVLQVLRMLRVLRG